MMDFARSLIGLPSAQEAARLNGQQRSKQWPKARAVHLKTHNVCEASGTTIDLEVHHVFPFHLFPDRELDPHNFIVLSGTWGTFNLHFLLGHGGRDWSHWNPEVRQAAFEFGRMLKRIQKNGGDPKTILSSGVSP